MLWVFLCLRNQTGLGLTATLTRQSNIQPVIAMAHRKLFVLSTERERERKRIEKYQKVGIY